MTRRGASVMFVNPIQRQSVQGRGEYAFVKADGTSVPAGRTFSKGVGKRYQFPSSIDGQQLKTGLQRLVPNPWYGKEPKKVNENLPSFYHIGADWRNNIEKLVQDEEITKQLELEIRFNLEEGYLTNRKLLQASFKSRNKNMDDAFNFLETFKIILYDRPNRFADDTLRGALAQEMAKVSMRIADSKTKANPSMHHFYISEENEAAIERAAKQDVVNDAVTDLTLLRRNHDPFISYQVAIILKRVKGRVAPITVKDELNLYVTTTNKKQIDNIKEFNRLVKLMDKGAEGMAGMWVEYLLQQALNSNIMSIKAGEYIWHSKKGIDNLHNLGSNKKAVLKLFLTEFNKYQGDNDTENWYKDLLVELKSKGIKLEE